MLIHHSQILYHLRELDKFWEVDYADKEVSEISCHGSPLLVETGVDRNDNDMDGRGVEV